MDKIIAKYDTYRVTCLSISLVAQIDSWLEKVGVLRTVGQHVALYVEHNHPSV